MLIIASGCTPADETPDGFPDATLPDIESEVAPYTRSAVDLAVPEFSLTTLSGDTFSPDDLTCIAVARRGRYFLFAKRPDTAQGES